LLREPRTKIAKRKLGLSSSLQLIRDLQTTTPTTPPGTIPIGVKLADNPHNEIEDPPHHHVGPVEGKKA
jgi:hypothetical protein